MAGDPTEAAVQRIEAALARIARAAEAPRAPAATDSSASVAALVDKHERLRESVAQTLAELDAVLGEIER